MVAEIVVGWMAGRAAGVTDAGSPNSGQTPKLGVGRPESAQGKSRRFQFARDLTINRRPGLSARPGRFFLLAACNHRYGKKRNSVEQSPHGRLPSGCRSAAIIRYQRHAANHGSEFSTGCLFRSRRRQDDEREHPLPLWKVEGVQQPCNQLAAARVFLLGT